MDGWFDGRYEFSLKFGDACMDGNVDCSILVSRFE